MQKSSAEVECFSLGCHWRRSWHGDWRQPWHGDWHTMRCCYSCVARWGHWCATDADTGVHFGYILPLYTVSRTVRKANIFQKVTADMQKMIAFWSISKSAIRHHLHANKLFKRYTIKKKHCFSSNLKCKCLDFFRHC